MIAEPGGHAAPARRRHAGSTARRPPRWPRPPGYSDLTTAHQSLCGVQARRAAKGAGTTPRRSCARAGAGKRTMRAILGLLLCRRRKRRARPARRQDPDGGRDATHRCRRPLLHPGAAPMRHLRVCCRWTRGRAAWCSPAARARALAGPRGARGAPRAARRAAWRAARRRKWRLWRRAAAARRLGAGLPPLRRRHDAPEHCHRADLDGAQYVVHHFFCGACWRGLPPRQPRRGKAPAPPVPVPAARRWPASNAAGRRSSLRTLCFRRRRLAPRFLPSPPAVL